MSRPFKDAERPELQNRTPHSSAAMSGNSLRRSRSSTLATAFPLLCALGVACSNGSDGWLHDYARLLLAWRVD
eukprot:4461002-Amphidinium_carterae.1